MERAEEIRIPEEELASQGDLGCPGCGVKLALRYALKALGPRTVLVAVGGCGTAAWFPYSPVSVPMILPCIDAGASTAAGVRAALDMQGRTEGTVAVWGGDGSTLDLGFQPLSAVAERNEDILYICHDNEAYMNTGIQRSSATPWGAWTTTTPLPAPKDQPKKNLPLILAAHRVPYVATVSIAFPQDFIAKVMKARDIKGLRYIHALTPCPTGWRFSPSDTIKVARLAVLSRVFPLFEIEDGTRVTLSRFPQVPVAEYLKLQGRFGHLSAEDIESIQQQVAREWEELERKAASSR